MNEQDTTTLGRIARIRERFGRRPDQRRSWLDKPLAALRFLGLAIAKAREDDLRQQSSALAFITIFSLVPLLVSFSFIGARAFAEQQEVMVELLSQILPYSEETIVHNLEEFLDQAQTIRGFGSLLFLVTAMLAFMTIEKTLNQIWNVPQRRPFRTRLLSFTLLLFWGPLLIGGAYSGLFYLRQQPAFQSLAESLPVQLVQFSITVLGLTMLYWMVPYTQVRFRSALGGGFLAAVLVEGLRHGFGLYIEHFRGFSIIYGSLGLALFFMISIYLTWWIVLLGAETAYCVQNVSLLSRPRRRAAGLEGSWLALAALAFITDRFRRSEPITPHEHLAEHLRLPAEDLREVLCPLLREGLLRETAGESEGYLLSVDPYELEITRVFELYEGNHWELFDHLATFHTEKLEELRARLAEGREKRTEGVLLADLVRAKNHQGEKRPEVAEPAESRSR